VNVFFLLTGFESFDRKLPKSWRKKILIGKKSFDHFSSPEVCL
jgi:hypothetical protein